ncbi:hypothetical protein D3C78_1684810 [compost metagenome]
MRQDLLRNALDLPAQQVEAHRLHPQPVEDQQRPFVGDPVQHHAGGAAVFIDVIDTFHGFIPSFQGYAGFREDTR